MHCIRHRPRSMRAEHNVPRPEHRLLWRVPSPFQGPQGLYLPLAHCLGLIGRRNNLSESNGERPRGPLPRGLPMQFGCKPPCICRQPPANSLCNREWSVLLRSGPSCNSMSTCSPPETPFNKSRDSVYCKHGQLPERGTLATPTAPPPPLWAPITPTILQLTKWTGNYL